MDETSRQLRFDVDGAERAVTLVMSEWDNQGLGMDYRVSRNEADELEFAPAPESDGTR